MIFFIQASLVYFDLQNSNPMSIYVGRDQKTTAIRKKRIFRIVENIRYGGRGSQLFEYPFLN